MNDRNDKLVFWGCFIALITTAFAFITRAFMVNDPGLWPKTFGLDTVQGQELFNAGIWPFAISIILFSLIIDKIGYRVAMVFSFVCYALYALLAFRAYGTVNAEGLEGQALKDAQTQAYQLLYWGSIILGLGNGTVEAYINPVVATMFNRDKTKWLNILHAGWPGGLVLGGLLTIMLGTKVAEDWRVLIVIIAIPAIIFLVMLIKARFPVNERVAAGATYREMLGEFGAIGAAIAGFLIMKELGGVFGWSNLMVIAIVAVLVVAYGFYCKSPGRPMMIFLCIVMFPLATTELGTDGAITGIMQEPLQRAGQDPLWVLIYTSAIMTVLRFFSGPIVHKLTPLGLLATCAGLAAVGLMLLSVTTTLIAIFAAATLYGIGKTFFWPTTLGVVSEQFPKGGALTLNAIAGIGMLSVGIVGGPLIGAMQEKSMETAVGKEMEGTYAKISEERSYFLGKYNAVVDDKVKDLPEADATKVGEVTKGAKQGALAKVAVFPIIMLLCYIGLIMYFKSRGGYKPVEIGGDGGGH
ncbi:MAG: MFS transporter [Roseibacillus sp.]|nr:MFS transporter [Roseibacillus sp.]